MSLTLGLHPVVMGLLIVLFLLISVLMILTVLIQRPQGGGLSGAFGSGAGSGQTAFGARTGDALTIATISIFVIWLVTAASLKFALDPANLTTATAASQTTPAEDGSSAPARDDSATPPVDGSTTPASDGSADATKDQGGQSDSGATPATAAPEGPDSQGPTTAGQTDEPSGEPGDDGSTPPGG